jgi:hypothetical protein
MNKKGKEFETMPFFLSDEFKTMLEDKLRGTGMSGADFKSDSLGNTMTSAGGGLGSGGSQMYKSIFLKEKINEQNEKRKKDRKLKKAGGPGAANENQMPEHSLFGAGSAGNQGKKKRGAGDDTIVSEEVQEVIDDLKNDLRIRDMEYEELKAAMSRLESDNARLRQQFEKERAERIVIEGKLMKTAIHNELKDNFTAITQSTFFE